MLQHLTVRREALFAMLGLAIAWQIASFFFPVYLFPPLQAIAAALAKIVSSWELLANAGATALRILAGLAGAFLLGVVFAVAMAKSRKANDYLFPLLHFNQGIPALSWVVISIIWFGLSNWAPIFTTFMITLPVVAVLMGGRRRRLRAHRTPGGSRTGQTVAVRTDDSSTRP